MQTSISHDHCQFPSLSLFNANVMVNRTRKDRRDQARACANCCYALTLHVTEAQRRKTYWPRLPCMTNWTVSKQCHVSNISHRHANQKLTRVRYHSRSCILGSLKSRRGAVYPAYHIHPVKSFQRNSHWKRWKLPSSTTLLSFDAPRISSYSLPHISRN